MKLFADKLYKVWYCYAGLYLFRREPVIILSPGRSGSISLYQSLKTAGFFTFKVEFVNKDTRGTAKFAMHHILYGRKKAKIIVLIRDPIDMMVTYFFSKAQKGWLPEAHKALHASNVPKLIECFTTEVLKTERLAEHLNWFENDFQELTSIYLFRSELHREDYKFINDVTYPTLALRTELDNKTKQDILGDFLDSADIEISLSNTAKQKPYYRIIREFKEKLVLEEELLDRIYDSRYAKTFLRKADIELSKKRFSR